MNERYTRLAPSGSADVDSSTSRVVSYKFSDESVGRDLHVVRADAWRTDAFEANPVFLWAHDDTMPPIGRVLDLQTVSRTLRGSVQYAETPFADSIYQLVRSGYINAVSMSWQPLEWSFSRDKARPGGVDFTKVDLLEISQVPVPALPTALASARARRTNLRPLAEWAERALDTTSSARFSAVPREHVEALYRAIRQPVTRSEQLRRAQQLKAQGDHIDRVERARALRDRIAREDADSV